MQLPKAPFALCHKCPFKDRAFAKTVGPADAKLAVVSRSPGHYEALNGKSFAGPSGKVLDHLLQLQGVERKQVLATNVVLCQSDGSESGFGMAQACCEPRLEAEIAQADTVIAAGAEAVTGLLGSGGIAMNRGYVHYRDSIASHPEKGSLWPKQQRVIVTNNPAMVLRDDAVFPELVRDFRLAINPLPEPKLPEVKWTEDIDEAREWIPVVLELLKPGTLVAADIEGGYPNLACIGFSIRPERSVVFGRSVVETILAELRCLLEAPEVRYLWHNGKYDVKALRRFGIDARVDEDSMLLSYACDERPGDPESGAGGHSLEWLLKDELGWPKYEPTSVRTFKKLKTSADYEEHMGHKRNRIDLYEYNGMDTAGALALFEVLRVRAENDNVWGKPYRSILLRLSEALTKIELVGNLFDADAACDILEEQVWPKLRQQRSNMREWTDKPALNPMSPKQLEELLYDEWGIQHDLDRPKIERRGKRSTDKLVREVILKGNYRSNAHPERVKMFVQELDDHKSLAKWKGSTEGYVLRSGSNGRLYTDFKIHGTESGRLSSSNPNLQNVTRPKEGLPNIRRAFIADPGCRLISADLSQAELRTIAVLSGDENLRAIYLDTNRSLHKEVATEFYGKDYTYEQYVRAKNINFGVAYWQSAFSFAQLYHMPQEEAQKFIDFWWNRFPQVKEWTKSIEKAVYEVGELQSPFGHKRRFYVIPQDNSGRLHVVKEGINFLPQNIAANVTLWAMCNLVSKLDWEVAQVRLSVHDSILVNCKSSHIEEVAVLMKAELEKAPQESIGWQFPYLADLSVGYNWGEMEDLVL